MMMTRGALLAPAGVLLGVLVACSGGSGSGTGHFGLNSSSSSSGSSSSGSGSGSSSGSDGGSSSGPAGPDSGAPDTGAPDAGSCIDTSSSDPCSSNTDCCQQGANQPLGATCAGQTGSSLYTCHAICSSNSDCTSGCCAAVSGGGSVCAPASDCAVCATPGQSCTTTQDCCQSGPTAPNGETCVQFSAGAECASVCYHNADCSSNCCAQLQGQSYGACVSNPSSSTYCMP